MKGDPMDYNPHVFGSQSVDTTGAPLPDDVIFEPDVIYETNIPIVDFKEDPTLDDHYTKRIATISVYMRDSGGLVFNYTVEHMDEVILAGKIREHIGQIARYGYRHNSGDGTIIHYMPHWIDKIKASGLTNVPTSYPDSISGT